MFSVGEAFLHDKQCTNCSDEVMHQNDTKPRFTDGVPRKTVLEAIPGEIPMALESLWSNARAGTLERLEPAQCIDEYATSIQSNRKNLLLVSGDDNFPSPMENYFIHGSHVYWAAKFEVGAAAESAAASKAFQWVCSMLDKKHEYLATPCSVEVEDVRKQKSWQVGWLCDKQGLCAMSRSPVEYCLSEPAQPHCKLHFEPTIATIITILNLCKFNSQFPCLRRRNSMKHTSVDYKYEIEPVLIFPTVKAGIMFYVAFCVHDEPLMTMGDAVASFLDKKDMATKNMCLSTLADFQDRKGYQMGPRQWSDKGYRWKDVTSKSRRITTVVM